MNFLLWLFILSGLGIVVFLIVKTIQEKFQLKFPLYEKRQHLERKLSVATEKSIHFMEIVHAGMFIDMLHTVINLMKHIFDHHKQAVKEKAAALSRQMIVGKEDLEKKPSEFLNDVSSVKDRFREK